MAPPEYGFENAGPTLPVNMAPPEGGLENVGPKLPPPLVEGMLSEFDGDVEIPGPELLMPAGGEVRVGPTLPTGMAPPDGGFENAGPTLPPPLVEGTLPDVDGEGAEDEAGIVTTIGDDDVGGDGADEAVGEGSSTPAIPPPPPPAITALASQGTPSDASPPSAPSTLSSPTASSHGLLKARLCPAKLA